MYIRHVRIRRFRGVASLDWNIEARLVCLVGPGDSTKTTVLDAIGYALSPRWSLPVHDGDFHGGDTSRPIEIQVTVTHPPLRLQAEDKYGHYLRGWSPSYGLRDDPEPEDETALTVQLCIGESLEPVWTVIKDARPEGKPISAADRAALQLFRIDDHIDQHLGWGRGSALAALTGDLSKIPTILANAHRQARIVVFERANPQLQAAATSAQTAAVELGVAPRETFRPGLDPRVGGRAALILHDGEIPAAAAGLGSRRLTALAIQRAQVQAGSIMVIDEIEHGLEPHRLMHLLAKLRAAVAPPAGGPDAAEGDPEHGCGQILMSTHSPVAVTELRAEDLHVVRAQAGKVKIQPVPDALDTITHSDAQGAVRAGAAAMLAKRVVVCEGATEVGLCRALAAHWALEREVSLAHIGTATTNGVGDTQAIRYASCFAELGYPTAVLLDSDTTVDTAAAEAAGVTVVRWSGGVALEERVALDLPDHALVELVELAIAETGGEQAPVLDAIAARLPGNPRLTETDPTAWVGPTCSLDDIRRAIGAAAKEKGWFKRQDHGEVLGQPIIRALSDCVDTDLVIKIQQLERFAYNDPEPDSRDEPIASGAT